MGSCSFRERFVLFKKELSVIINGYKQNKNYSFHLEVNRKQL